MLSFKRQFDAEMTIGDHRIPIKVRRLNHSELEQLVEGWERLVVVPPGNTPAPAADATNDERHAYLRAETARYAEWAKANQKEREQYFTDAIESNITLESGLIEDNDQPVTDGIGLVRIFRVRPDVLRDLTAIVISKNKLTDVLEKKSPSPRASAPISGPSVPSRGGDEPGPTAANARPSGSAASATATDETTDESSGGTPHVH